MIRDTIDPVVRRAAITAAAAHLLYGGTDVLFAGAAFCLFWRVGITFISEKT